MSVLSRARALRRASTDPERLLWRHLRARRTIDAKFRRQQPIGPYIVDFVCYESRLVVELDGGQHCERTREDAARDSFLRSRGFRVMRFWNDEAVQRTAEVLEAIYRAIAESKRLD
jgi:very-short-patch-repair endonuclease